MDCNTYFSSLRPFLAENDASAWQQRAQLTTVIHIFTLFLPSFSPRSSLSLPLVFQPNACL